MILIHLCSVEHAGCTRREKDYVWGVQGLGQVVFRPFGWILGGLEHSAEDLVRLCQCGQYDGKSSSVVYITFALCSSRGAWDL